METILDIGSCHMGKWDYIKEAIDLADSIGANYLKFQLFKGSKNGNIEFPRNLWRKTIEYAQTSKTKIFASVFDFEAVDLLADSGIKKVKLAYSQNFNLPLIKKCQKLGLEIWASGDKEAYPDYADVKLFCVPEYPVKRPLNLITLPIDNFDGFSSHYMGIDYDVKIMKFSEWKYIEKHFTLDHDDINCPDHMFALSPAKLKEFVKRMREVENVKNMRDNTGEARID